MSAMTASHQTHRALTARPGAMDRALLAMAIGLERLAMAHMQRRATAWDGTRAAVDDARRDVAAARYASLLPR